LDVVGHGPCPGLNPGRQIDELEGFRRGFGGGETRGEYRGGQKKSLQVDHFCGNASRIENAVNQRVAPPC
jgi:hypothetical protein